jgi:hypothetical protein
MLVWPIAGLCQHRWASESHAALSVGSDWRRAVRDHPRSTNGCYLAPFAVYCPLMPTSLAWPLPHEVHRQPAGIQEGGHVHARSVSPSGDRQRSRKRL